MKHFQKIVLLLAVALVPHLRAETIQSVKFSGTAVDAEGKPVAGATVECFLFPTRMMMSLPEIESRQQATTDSKGAFAFSVPTGAVTVTLKKVGFGSAWKTWQTVPTGAIEPLVLGARSTLAGTVVDEKDGPIAGAEVSVSMAVDRNQSEWTSMPNYIFGKVAGELFSARTSADGRFRIVDFPAGAQANLAVSVPGRALRVTSSTRNGMQLQAQAGKEDIKLTMDPAASIEGEVVIRDSGAPLGHARIQLQPLNSSAGFSTPMPSVQCGADGMFRISEIPAGSYRLTAVFTNEPVPSWVSEGVPVTVAAGETARNVKIQAFKGGLVEVTVVRKNDQKGLANVAVMAYAEGYQGRETTAASGVAWLRLPPGQFQMMAMKEGMSQAQSQATVVEGQTNRVKIELNLPFKVSGIVRDSTGAPVANTVVGVFPNFSGNMSESRSDAGGHYEATWQQPSWSGMQEQRYYLVARNVERKLGAVQEIQATTTSLDVELKEAASVTGRVQDVNGKPITNATAYIIVQMDNNGFSINRQPIRTDGEGRIQIEALPKGEHYSLSVSANGYGSSQHSIQTSGLTENHYEFTPVVLKSADRKLAGRVLGADGQPVAGVQVWMRGEGQPNGNATTDAKGRFAFDSVCDGAVSLTANSKGFYGSFDAMGGDTNVTIRFNANNRAFNQMASLTISGTVYDPSGNPAAGARVGVTPAWGQVDSATTGTNGDYSVHWQDQPGMRGAKYFVVARDTERNLAGVEEIDAKKTQASVRMAPGFSISGTVQDANGQPLTHANVNLNMMAGNMGGMVAHEPVRLESDGTFTISALPKGQQYHVYVSANGYGSAQKSVSRIQSQSNSIQLAPLKLKTADRELAGQVLGEDGKPLPGVQVYTFGNNQPNVNARTDSAGHFAFKVCSGPINVNAFVPQGGPRNNYGTAQARGGDVNVIVKIGARPVRQPMMRALSLKPQPWTLSAVIPWIPNHKATVITLLALQTAAFLGAAGGVLWATGKRKE